ncbi:hypothetical protein BaRGS_00004305, partial [Batillaria attramentaria]
MSSVTLPLTPDVTSTTNSTIWKSRVATPSSVYDTRMRKSTDTIHFWSGIKQTLAQNNDIQPTLAPNTSLVDFHFPELSPPPPQSAANIPDVKGQHVRFDVTNHVNTMTSGKISRQGMAASRISDRRRSSSRRRGFGERKSAEHDSQQGKREGSLTLGGEAVFPEPSQDLCCCLSGSPPVCGPAESQRQTLLSNYFAASYAAVRPCTAVSVSLFDDDGGLRHGSAAKRSICSRLGISDDVFPGNEDGSDPYPTHPLLRMYQTRPGAFARLLSKDADPRVLKVAPGSTLASLMIPHPAVTGKNEEGVATINAEACFLKGTTV